MNTMSFFIGPQEIILFLIIVPGVIILLLIIAAIKYLNRNNRPKRVAKELEKEFNKYQDSLFSEKNIKDYYPVKEGNKITLIRFDEIVDFSTSNNYLFLTDVNGKDYLVDSNLMDLEAKLPKEFIRVHKSTIINSKLISEVKKLANGRYDLVMKCEKPRVIQCSKNYNEKIKTIIDF
ncbi:MAG: LytTR family transcriptional regulator DNA-binding domain-containing protein [Bacteroidetes bacterium]|nr:LytTR family transcriptional regulator DNA-binding domain-containing protein [Bacteroidota bacterium]